MRIKLPTRKKLLIIGSITIGLFIIVFFFFIYHEPAGAPANKLAVATTEVPKDSKSEDTQQQETEAKPTNQTELKPPEFNKSLYSLTEPSSLWVIVNKKRPLPSSYTPQLEQVIGGQLTTEAGNNLRNLISSAGSSGHNLSIISSYRSYATQSSTYNGWVAKDGQAVADTYSARPGYSEHQTGLAVDLGSGVCNLEICFGSTTAGIWLANNAHLFGFIVRYPNGKDTVTGYQYEPWHLRYVGNELSREIAKTPNQTLEEFFGLEAAPNY